MAEESLEKAVEKYSDKEISKLVVYLNKFGKIPDSFLGHNPYKRKELPKELDSNRYNTFLNNYNMTLGLIEDFQDKENSLTFKVASTINQKKQNSWKDISIIHESVKLAYHDMIVNAFEFYHDEEYFKYLGLGEQKHDPYDTAMHRAGVTSLVQNHNNIEALKKNKQFFEKFQQYQKAKAAKK